MAPGFGDQGSRFRFGLQVLGKGIGLLFWRQRVRNTEVHLESTQPALLAVAWDLASTTVPTMGKIYEGARTMLSGFSGHLYHGWRSIRVEGAG